MKPLHRWKLHLSWLVLVLAGCGGRGDDPQWVVVDLPAASTSRIAAIEYDDGADGRVDRVVRHTYGDTGLLTKIETWAAVDGMPSGDPVEAITRTYDAHGRILTIASATSTSTLEVTYGADGRLATTSTRSAPSFTYVRWFKWDADQMKQVADDSGVIGNLSYDALGRVIKIEWERGDDVDVETYGWTADGQLESYTYNAAVGWLMIYTLSYDSEGRIVDWLSNDDGVRYDMRRFEYDDRRRPVKVEIDPGHDPADNYPFRVGHVIHIKWEDLPCQPTYEPEPPPTLDLAVTSAASPIGATLVCAN